MRTGVLQYPMPCLQRTCRESMYIDEHVLRSFQFGGPSNNAGRLAYREWALEHLHEALCAKRYAEYLATQVAAIAAKEQAEADRDGLYMRGAE